MSVFKVVLYKLFLTGFIVCSYHLCSSQQTEKYFIKAGKIFDSESGSFKTDMAILVKGTVIEAVKPQKDVTTQEKEEYEMIDLRGMTVLPGLIDAHMHLLSHETIYPDNPYFSLNYLKEVTLKSDAYRALYGAARAKGYLEAGFTAVQDLGNSGLFADIALRDAINDGLVPGPRMRCSGLGLSTEGGQFPGLTFNHRDLASFEYRIVRGTADAIEAVRENITQKADVIKIYANNTPNRTMMSIEEIKAIVQEAHRYGVRVTAHATSNVATYNAIIGGVDAIEHCYDIEDSTLELMSQKGVVLIPTDGDTTTLFRYLEKLFPGNASNRKRAIALQQWPAKRIQRALQKKVTIVAGSDDYADMKVPYGETAKRTMIAYYESSMTIPDVLKTTTINAAKHLRWENKIGILKKGCWADIIAVEGDLEKDIHAILKTKFVMKNGKIYVR